MHSLAKKVIMVMLITYTNVCFFPGHLSLRTYDEHKTWNTNEQFKLLLRCIQ